MFHPIRPGWKKITINVSNLNLSYVLGGFAWVAAIADNPNGAVFYLDDIQYELNNTALTDRLKQPRFLRSFTTLPIQPDPTDANTDDDFDLVCAKQISLMILLVRCKQLYSKSLLDSHHRPDVLILQKYQ